MEIGYAVRRESDTYSIERSDRGANHTIARFPTQADADRMLLMMIGEAWRSEAIGPPTRRSELAEGTVLEQTGDGWELIWPGGAGSFTRSNTARRYSVVAALSLEELSVKLQDPSPWI